ncbi:hypothetical protein OU994_00520 [Pseudoduganella sp. SL102]|uniref:DUF6708 domain-containing protein n=1 Tax=Pseudoduganella sp. SL102 TaxID=2995154 RepID=UPI00248BF3ED|nr:DUF6708 domain-containing protein [Pseudoduganella sp. SL102]WBS02822.1 hypothetical protein OU994_00520 [Pseudoduganella sp. SL102]
MVTKDKQNREADVVSRYSKKRSASEAATTFSLVKKTYPDAVELTGTPPGTRGMLLLVACFFVFIAAISANQIAENVLVHEMRRVSHIITSIGYLAFIVLSIYLTAFCVRLELFKPEDEPIIFDRKNRKIYRLFMDSDSSWKGILRPWPVRVAEHDWDLAEAEHHVSVNANTATISRVHALIFQMRKSRASAEIVDGFAVGSSLQLGELTVPAVWEYIRRFMEENGDHLPNSESVIEMKKPASLLDSILAVGLYGENFRKWWRSERALTILALIFSPILYPVLTLLGLFVWLGYKTSKPIVWPEEIKRKIGNPLQ